MRVSEEEIFELSLGGFSSSTFYYEDFQAYQKVEIWIQQLSKYFSATFCWVYFIPCLLLYLISGCISK